MARTMTLNDGTQLEVRNCGADDELLSFVALGERTLPELVALLAVPGVADHIEVKGVEMVDTYDGFTELVAASSVLYSWGIFIALRKGAAADVFDR